MKIVVIGSSSTGKTTLCKKLFEIKLVKKIINVNIISILQQDNFTSIDNLTKQEFINFQEKIFECRENLEMTEADFISDRSFIDGIAYLMAKEIPYEKYLEKYLPYIKKYDYIFYLPIDVIPYESNLYRSNNQNFNQKVDLNIKYLLDKINIKYYSLEMIKLDERVNFIKQVVSKNV